MNMSKVVTRFAPSPTGFMHIGGVRTALFAYLYAKKMGGTFILRIEDTDKAREVAGSIEHIQEALAWLGIIPDIGPQNPEPFASCIQSERLHIYRAYAERLIEKGLAYPDPYTETELEAFRAAAEVEKRPFLFRHHRPESFETWDGTKPLRLKVPEVKRYQWHDAVRGDLEAGEEMVDDIILIKADGYPTYNFAHIVDDLEMGVTHIMRGDEFISSMPKFLSIYDALGVPYPTFVTLPPILRPDRTKKLGKRDGAKDILLYREEGYLPETMVNFLALIGWNPGTTEELFTMDALKEVFAIEKIQRSGGAFNEEKLLWMNKEYLTKLSDADFARYAQPFLKREDGSFLTEDLKLISRFAPALRERTSVGTELTAAVSAGEYDFIAADPTVSAALLQFKKDPSPKEALPRLEQVVTLLSNTDFISAEAVKAAIFPYAEAVGKGEVLWPVRVALTGLERSPDPFTVAYGIGREATLRRLTTAIATLKAN